MAKSRFHAYSLTMWKALEAALVLILYTWLLWRSDKQFYIVQVLTFYTMLYASESSKEALYFWGLRPTVEWTWEAAQKSFKSSDCLPRGLTVQEVLLLLLKSQMSMETFENQLGHNFALKFICDRKWLFQQSQRICEKFPVLLPGLCFQCRAPSGTFVAGLPTEKWNCSVWGFFWVEFSVFCLVMKTPLFFWWEGGSLSFPGPC